MELENAEVFFDFLVSSETFTCLGMKIFDNCSVYLKSVLIINVMKIKVGAELGTGQPQLVMVFFYLILFLNDK